MKKKTVSVLLAALMTFSVVLGGCGLSGGGDTVGTDVAQGEETNAGQEEAGENENAEVSGTEDLSAQEPYTVKWFYPCSNVPTNVEKIENAINEITVPAINVTVDLECMTISNYANQVTLLTSSGEKLDIFVATGSTVTDYYENGSCIAITDYVNQYGQGILDTVNTEYGETYLESFRIDGDLYSLPTMHSVVNQTGFNIVESIVDELDLRADLDAMETLEDLTPILAKIKEAHPDMYPIAGDPGLGVITQYLEGVFDDIGDTYVVVEGYDNTKVVNRFATDTYRKLLDLVHEWYQAGYIMPGVDTNDMEVAAQYKEGRACMSLGQTQPKSQNGQIHTYMSTSSGVPCLNYCLSESRMTTKQMASPQLLISVNSDAPERAMQLLNLFYTSPELNNLVNFGIEGEDYVLTDEEGVITFPEGIDMNNVEYSVKFGWAFPNQFLGYVWEGTDADEWEKTRAVNHEGEASAAAGFLFLTGNVSTETATVKNVVEKYSRSLENGTVDVDTVLPEFISALEDAGINKIVEEKQSQVDAWLANK